MYEKYEHHGGEVWVRSDLKGKHREHCLCLQGCKKFKMGDAVNNCKKAQLLFAFCCLNNMTTPVWECPDFEEGN
jgi:hypothetical protein